ncbi:MAG: cytochrome c [Acidobacteriota bacterium]|nr:cytochrome c [Acidobacteriota bacterium]
MALRVMVVILAPLALGACRQDMHDNPRSEPLEASRVFADRSASRTLVEGTVPRGHLNDDDFLHTGKQNGQPVTTFPFAVTREVLDRGENRFNIYCAPCHSRIGDGNGMVVQRGHRQPPSFHIDRLRDAPPGYMFDVMTSGFGAMPDYRAQISPRDRWAVVAYVKALQLSQNATMADVPEADRGKLSSGGAPGTQHGAPSTPSGGGH